MNPQSDSPTSRDTAALHCLLLQVRDADDPMGPHELVSFQRILSPFAVRISIFDLLERSLLPRDLEGVDLVLMGGSGKYSATSTDPWLETALDSLRLVHASQVPAFASCWGFQGMAAAMGGEVVHDRGRAEVGTHELVLTSAGRADPVFEYLGSPFRAQFGHEDLVETLPPRTTLLASSAKVVNQAYRFEDAPIYCTQFHPELDADGLRSRFLTYPRYAAYIAGTTLEELLENLENTPDAERLVRRFVELHVMR
ncbi:MAG: type 1 glutamine amidotransferase [Gemmatimonadetes bacterium]|nr:type 1 glutamine amidotransferase [Gemmatimonadota bacterium]